MATNYVQKATGASPAGLTDSQLFDDGTNVGIATTSPSERLDVVGNAAIRADSADLGPETYAQPTFQPAHDKWQASDDFSFVGNVPTYLASSGSGTLFRNNRISRSRRRPVCTALNGRCRT